MVYFLGGKRGGVSIAVETTSNYGLNVDFFRIPSLPFLQIGSLVSLSSIRV